MNIRKIAHKAGVSPATVSRVFKNSESISQKTKDKVFKVARSSGYYPDKNIPGAKPQRNKTFAFLVPREERGKIIYHNVNFYSSVFAGFKKAVDECQGRILSIPYTINALEEELVKIDWREIQGLAIIHTSLKDDEFIKRNAGIFKAPFVVLNRKFPDKNPVNYICVDEELGGYNATTYLHNLGHEWIACLALRQDFAYLRQRVNGYKKAMMGLGPIDTTNKLIIGYCRQIKDSYEQAKKLLRKEKRITAIFLNEEELATGLFEALQELGKRVPEDISIVAYNDYVVTLCAKPQLSTIRLPTREMGYLAGRMLQDMRRVAIRSTFRIVLSPQLIERTSCLRRK